MGLCLLLLANAGIDLQMHAVMHRERGRAEMNGEGRRLEVEVERAETDGGEEGECEEKTDFVHALEKMEGKRISWKLKWRLSGGWRRSRGGWGTGVCMA